MYFTVTVLMKGTFQMYNMINFLCFKYALHKQTTRVFYLSSGWSETGHYHLNRNMLISSIKIVMTK